MAINIFFDVCGPFIIRRVGKSAIVVDQKVIIDFWNRAEKKHANLSHAIGCYVFGIKDGNSVKPFYVGKTARSFKSEVLKFHKINHYNKVVARRRGYPVLFLLPKMTRSGSFFSTNAAGIKKLEKLLIDWALVKNPKLLNERETKFLRTT